MKARKPGSARFTRYLLQPFTDEEMRETIIEDLEDRYLWNRENKGPLAAKIIWGFKLIIILISFTIHSISWRIIMFRNYFKITLRNIKKHKGFSLINVAGLTLGLTFSILIMIYVRYEFSYDRFHKNADQIYRVLSKNKRARSGSLWWNATPGVLKSILLDEFPEVENASRLCLWRSIISLRGFFSANEVQHLTTRVYMVDPEFLEIFSFPLAAGNPDTALDDPFSILITQEMAEKFFGRENPVGKKITADNAYDYKITGVLKNIPQNSHVKYDFLISFSTLYAFPEGKEGHIDRWGSQNYVTYIQLAKGVDPKDVEEQFPAMIKKHRGEKFENHFYLNPMTDIHLHSNINLDLDTNNDIRFIYLLSAIAIIIMFIACCNYMNLSTARSSLRFKEVGVRKVVGAGRRHLIRQFLGESLLFTFLGLLFSLLLVIILLPAFSRFVERDMHFSLLSGSGPLIALILGITLLAGILAGSYPAFFLSSFRPVNVIKGAFKAGSKKPFHIRNFLVVLQFAISIGLIVCTAVIYNQLNFIKNKDLGFRKDHIVTVRIQDQNLRQNHEPLMQELHQQAKILDVTVSDDLPSAIRGGGSAQWEGKPEDVHPSFYNAFVGYNFLDFFGIKLVSGRNFSREFPTDKNAYILNERAVKTMGLENPLGKRFRMWKDEGTIIGIVEDFHFYPLQLNIDPVVLSLTYKGDDDYLLKYGTVNYFSIKINSDDIPGSLSVVESVYKRFTEYPFSYTFLDERIDRMYSSEQKLGKTLIFFSLVAVFIACLGLFGLASFTAEQKTKEIGIRRILGASVPTMVVMLVRLFLRWLLLSSLIAWPVAYLIMTRWMQNFAYRAEMKVWIYAAAPALVALIALLTVGFQSFKAAVANPADCLRYE
jgi:ABC-type antimicrobial peptide transport system permease subunit